MSTGAKNKIYVSASAPATFDETGWEAVTGWQELPCGESIPALVKELEEVVFTCLSSGAAETFRGVAAPIPFEPPVRDDPANAGQVLVKAAFDATNGSSAELLSLKIDNDGSTQQIYMQVKVTAYGTGERVTNSVTLRVVKMSGDAATLHEVNS
jgi:hypothetical protein